MPATPPDVPRSRIHWQERWGLARPLEYAAILTFGAGALAMQSVPVVNRHWGGNGFDNAFRDALRIENPSGRHAARSVSDGLFFGMMGFPLVVDTLLVAGPRDSTTAWQLLVVNGEAMTMAGFLSQVIERTGGRTRPFVQECGKDAGYKTDCEGEPDERYESFLSGHTLMAFNGAGLTCANHLHIPLYGGGAPDVLACVAGIAIASTEGVLRISSDRHYMTDVLTGALIGFATGYSVPIFLHYGRRGGGDAAVSTAVLPYATASTAGLQILGAF